MRINHTPALFFGGRIYTMEPRQPLCDAMIIRDGRIAWLGTAGDLSAIPSGHYEMIDLDGRTIFPGFIDSHTHIVFWSLSRTQIDLDGATSYEDALARIRRHLKANPARKGAWITGKGWKKEQWKSVRWPHKRDLDRLVPDRPAAIYSKDEHVLWANSRALEIAGITRSTPDPFGGEIIHDADGEPTGILKDNADNQVWDKYVPPSLREMKPIMEAGFAEMYRQGCVGVTSFDSLNGFEVLQALDAERQLPVKVVYYLPVATLDDAIKLKLRSGFGSQRLSIGGVKIFADGALGSQTALMLKPFKGSKTNVGIEVTSPSELRRLVATATKSGLACAIHAIGDRANRNVLDAFETVGKHASRKFHHRIEHCQILDKRDLPRFKKQGVIASVQPSHAASDIDIMKKYLGERQKDSYRMRSLLKTGVTQCFGSDAPIEELHPLHGIYAAVTGKRVGGKVAYSRTETVTVEQAIRGFTVEGARAVGDADNRGSLAVGKCADFVVLDRNLMRCASEQILDTNVVATYIDGELKYSGNGFPE